MFLLFILFKKKFKKRSAAGGSTVYREEKINENGDVSFKTVLNTIKASPYSPAESSRTDSHSPTETAKTNLQTPTGSPNKSNLIAAHSLLSPTSARTPKSLNPLTAAYHNMSSMSQCVNIQTKIDDINE